MAEMIKMRTGNHKAEWSEDALIILEEFATAKVQGRAGACGRCLPFVQKIIPLLEVEPRGEPPEEYLLMERRKGVHLSKQPKGASVLTTQQKMMRTLRDNGFDIETIAGNLGVTEDVVRAALEIKVDPARDLNVRWYEEKVEKWREIEKKMKSKTWDGIAEAINLETQPINFEMFSCYTGDMCRKKAIDRMWYDPSVRKKSATGGGAGRPKLEWDEKWLAEMIKFFPHTPRGAELKPYAIVRKGYNHMEEKFGSAFTDKIKIEPFRSKVKEMVEASELNKTGKLNVVDHMIKTTYKISRWLEPRSSRRAGL